MTTKTSTTHIGSRPVCTRCTKPIPVCYCHTLTPIENSWPVIIIQHQSEVGHAIGTAPIAQLSLTQCQTLIQPKNPGQNEKSIDQQVAALLTQSLQPLLVYPDEQAKQLPQLKQTAIRPLIFLDATWRKSRRLLHEFPELNKLEKIALHPPAASRYRIRKSTNKSGLSTIEAIAFTLGELEKNHNKYQPLLHSMDWIIDQQVAAMGNEVYQKNYAVKL